MRVNEEGVFIQKADKQILTKTVKEIHKQVDAEPTPRLMTNQEKNFFYRHSSLFSDPVEYIIHLVKGVVFVHDSTELFCYSFYW